MLHGARQAEYPRCLVRNCGLSLLLSCAYRWRLCSQVPLRVRVAVFGACFARAGWGVCAWLLCMACGSRLVDSCRFVCDVLYLLV